MWNQFSSLEIITPKRGRPVLDSGSTLLYRAQSTHEKVQTFISSPVDSSGYFKTRPQTKPELLCLRWVGGGGGPVETKFHFFLGYWTASKQVRKVLKRKEKKKRFVVCDF